MSKFQKRDRRPLTPKIRGASVEVRNGDVNKALRTLKKILENDDRQKELAKREYHEKPSTRRKRRRAAAVKRHQKEQERKLSSGEIPYHREAGTAYMKSKRKRRKIDDKRNMFEKARRNR